MGTTCTVQSQRNSCKFFSESDKQKLARAISKTQVSDPGPSWPSCFQTLADIDLIFGMEVNHHVLQIDLEFRFAPSISGEITRLET